MQEPEFCQKCELVGKNSYDLGYNDCKENLKEILLDLERSINKLQLKLEVI